MKKFAVLALVAAALSAAPLAYAAKLAPPQNVLQPLPVNVQPAVSESVQRSASQTDLQTIENVQEEQENSASVQQNNALPVTPYQPASSSDAVALWIAFVIAAVVAGGAVWLWKSF